MPANKQNKIKVQVVDMSAEMKQSAEDQIKHAFDNFSKEERIA